MVSNDRVFAHTAPRSLLVDEPGTLSRRAARRGRARNLSRPRRRPSQRTRGPKRTNPGEGLRGSAVFDQKPLLPRMSPHAPTRTDGRALVGWRSPRARDFHVREKLECAGVLHHGRQSDARSGAKFRDKRNIRRIERGEEYAGMSQGQARPSRNVRRARTPPRVGTEPSFQCRGAAISLLAPALSTPSAIIRTFLSLGWRLRRLSEAIRMCGASSVRGTCRPRARRVR